MYATSASYELNTITIISIRKGKQIIYIKCIGINIKKIPKG
jgi:hypothetical protein